MCLSIFFFKMTLVLWFCFFSCIWRYIVSLSSDKSYYWICSLIFRHVPSNEDTTRSACIWPSVESQSQQSTWVLSDAEGLFSTGVQESSDASWTWGTDASATVHEGMWNYSPLCFSLLMLFGAQWYPHIRLLCEIFSSVQDIGNLLVALVWPFDIFSVLPWYLVFFSLN